jgi:hypothetical protein
VSRCRVCGLEGARNLRTHGGNEYGPAHDGTCGTLAWESFFLTAIKAPSHEVADVAWQMRRHAAGVNRRPFREPRPRSPGEMELDRTLAANDLEDVARELA